MFIVVLNNNHLTPHHWRTLGNQLIILKTLEKVKKQAFILSFLYKLPLRAFKRLMNQSVS